MTRTVKWGILSTARINHRVAPGIRASSLTELVGVASRDYSRAARAATELGAQTVFGSYQALLASNAIDAVYISLPNALHAEWVIRAAEAGKHVLCEKPLTSNAKEADQVVSACNRAGVLLMEAFMYRHHPQHTRVQDLISQGMIGEPSVFTSRFSYYLPPSDNIRWSGALAGGALMDIGCYCINASRLLFEAEPVSARAVWKYDTARGVDVTTLAILEYPRQRYAMFTCSMLMERTQSYEIVGSEGAITLPTAYVPRTTLPTVRLKTQSGLKDIAIPSVDQYRLQIEHFSQCILDEVPLRAPAENGLANMRAIETVKNAARIATIRSS